MITIPNIFIMVSRTNYMNRKDYEMVDLNYDIDEISPENLEKWT